MKILTNLLIAIIIPIISLAQEELNYPFDIVYHAETENYYVTNWAEGDAYILKLDKNGNIILRSAIDKIRKLYDTKITRQDSKEEMERKLKNIGDLLDFEKNGRRKILKQLNRVSLIKNTHKHINNNVDIDEIDEIKLK